MHLHTNLVKKSYMRPCKCKLQFIFIFHSGLYKILMGFKISKWDLHFYYEQCMFIVKFAYCSKKFLANLYICESV
jgi:hypothetical protein